MGWRKHLLANKKRDTYLPNFNNLHFSTTGISKGYKRLIIWFLGTLYWNIQNLICDDIQKKNSFWNFHLQTHVHAGVLLKTIQKMQVPEIHQNIGAMPRYWSPLQLVELGQKTVFSWHCTVWAPTASKCALLEIIRNILNSLIFFTLINKYVQMYAYHLVRQLATYICVYSNQNRKEMGMYRLLHAAREQCHYWYLLLCTSSMNLWKWTRCFLLTLQCW